MATGQWGGSFDQRVFRANIIWEAGLQRCMTGFHLRDVGVNTLDPEDVATEVADFASTEFIKILSNADTLVGVDAVNLETKEGHSVSFSGVTGTRTGPTLPTFITVPISLKGGIRRRYANGRMLWPVRSPDFIVANQLAGGGVTTFSPIIEDLQSRFIGSSLTTSMHMVHLHAELPALGNRPLVPATWYDITSVRLNTLLGSLRRRKVGVGS